MFFSQLTLMPLRGWVQKNWLTYGDSSAIYGRFDSSRRTKPRAIDCCSVRLLDVDQAGSKFSDRTYHVSWVLFGLASASLADPAAVQYAIRNFARSQRDRHTQSVHRTQFRFTHAPYVETAFACRANCTRARSVVRPCAFHRRWPVVGGFRKSDCQPHRSPDARLPICFFILR